VPALCFRCNHRASSGADHRAGNGAARAATDRAADYAAKRATDDRSGDGILCRCLLHRH
jgi:hypothetical protein